MRSTSRRNEGKVLVRKGLWSPLAAVVEEHTLTNRLYAERLDESQTSSSMTALPSTKSQPAMQSKDVTLLQTRG